MNHKEELKKLMLAIVEDDSINSGEILRHLIEAYKAIEDEEKNNSEYVILEDNETTDEVETKDLTDPINWSTVPLSAYVGTPPLTD